MGDVLILSYHAVSSTWPAALAVRPDALDAQLGALTSRGYRGATFEQAVLSPPHPLTLAVTFDDAYCSLLEVAKPILDRYGLVASVFVPTDYPDRGRPMAWPGIDRWLGSEHEHELIPLTWDDLGELAGSGWEIGSHSRSHPWLTRCDDERLDDELEGARRVIEERLGRPCRTLAYPFGDFDERVVAAARAAGYRAAAVVPDQLHSRDPLYWPRVGVYRADGDLAFRLKVSRAMRRVRSSPAWPPFARAVRTLRRRAAPPAAHRAP